MKNHELLTILSAISDAADRLGEFRRAIDMILECHFGLKIYEFSSWKDAGLDVVREAFAELRKVAENAHVGELIERWSAERKPSSSEFRDESAWFAETHKELAQIVCEAWSMFTARVDQLRLDAGVYNPTLWVSRQVEARTADRTLELSLDHAVEQMSTANELQRDLRAIGDAALGSGTVYASEADASDPHSVIINGLQSMIAAAEALRRDILETEEQNVYRGGLSDQDKIDAADSMRRLIRAMVLSRPELADFTLSDWRRSFADKTGQGSHALEESLSGPIESLPPAARPIACCERAFAAWERFQKETLKRLALADGLGPMTSWHSTLEPLYRDAVYTCSLAIEELVTNPVYDDHLITRAMKELGIGEEIPPTTAVEPQTASESSEEAVNEPEALPLSYDDHLVFARDKWLYEQRMAGKTLPWILDELERQVKENGWGPITSAEGIRSRIRVYAAAMALPVPKGTAGNPVNIAKARAKR